MNKLTLLALSAILLGPSALAHHKKQIVTLSNPVHGESTLRYSGESNSINGVCKSLGFSTGISGSLSKSSAHGYSAIMNGDGTLKRAGLNHYYISKITCANYTGLIPEVVEVIKNPVYPGTDTRYSGESNNSNGVCRSLGFDSGIQFKKSSAHGRSLIMNSDGDIKTMANNHYYISQIACASQDGYTSHDGTYTNPGSDAPPSLGFNFKERSLQVANTVYDVAKSIEPFLNNDEEVKIDALKKQAARLRARIKGRRKVNVVRNTLFHLGTLLQDAAPFIDSHLESDHLDHLAERLMTAEESILGMVDYVDNDFRGNASDLY